VSIVRTSDSSDDTRIGTRPVTKLVNKTVYDNVTTTKKVPVITKGYVQKPVTTYNKVKTGYDTNVKLVRNAPSRSYRSSSSHGYSRSSYNKGW